MSGPHEILRAIPNQSVSGHPRHQLRVHEVPAWAPNLPDTLVRFLPPLGQVAEEMALQGPRVAFERQAVSAGPAEGVDAFAIDVDLQLVGCRVTHPNRSGRLVSG
jgi:hypothetical protein